MYDLAVVNSTPGRCQKCGGSGVYSWGGTINGRAQHSGTCFSCRGTGEQNNRQRKRNETYNRHKVARILSGDFASARENNSDYVRDPGEDAADRWNEQYGDR